MPSTGEPEVRCGEALGLIGSVVFISGLPRREPRPFRRWIQMIFQDP